MKLCPKCSTKNENAAGFCKSCGESLADVPVTQEDFSAIAGGFLNKAKDAASAGAKKAQQVSEQRAEAKAMKQSEQFVDPSEMVKATLGTNFAQNMLAGGKVKRGSAILTEKRLYYKGDLFTGSGRSVMSIKGEYIVPIEDISMTSFIHAENAGGKLFGLLLILVGAVLFFKVHPAVGLVAAAAGAVFLIKAFLGKSTVLEVSFPGGRFSFDVKWYPIADMQDFQRQIHLMKDHLKENG